MNFRRLFAVAVCLLAASLSPRAAEPQLGYFRFPALSGDTLVFTAEGDLWKTTLSGGVAERLTAHPGAETSAAISPDGGWVAFVGTYEGPAEVFVLPLAGGVPKRLTWEGGPYTVIGWTPDNKVLAGTRRRSTLPAMQLVTIDPVSGLSTDVPLAQASDGDYGPDGTLFFTRLPFQGSNTRRYRGGTAQQIWRFAPAAAEATVVTGDYPGTSKRPMVWNNRVYFLSDRDGTMNIWSMALDGTGLTQHTRHQDYEVHGASLSKGRIAYQHGADLRVFDVAASADRPIPIRLVSDFDHVRERWISNPREWITSSHLSPTGDRVVLTARGQLFVVPVEGGRLVEATRNKKVRYRNGRFSHDGASLLALSDESGEVEFWQVPANGIGAVTQLTNDGAVLRWDGLPSPNGKYIAHHDKDRQLWVFDVATKKQTKLAFAGDGDFDDLAWSPDGKFLAYTAPEPNQLTRIYLWEAATGTIAPATSDRYDSVCTSSPIATSSRWSAARGDRVSRSRSTTNRRAFTTSHSCPAHARRSSRRMSCSRTKDKGQRTKRRTKDKRQRAMGRTKDRGPRTKERRRRTKTAPCPSTTSSLASSRSQSRPATTCRSRPTTSASTSSTAIPSRGPSVV